ncbi:MAG: ParA family protein [Candidatus Hermodarchaeota archaeon]
MQNKFHVLTFHSFKGGSGKTTLAINFAYYITELGYKTLLVENDLQMPTYTEIFQGYWENQAPIKFLNSYLTDPKNTLLTELIAPTTLKFDVICTDPNFDPQQFYALADQKMFRSWLITLQRTKARLQQPGKYEMIIIDCPPGWHCLIINNLIISDSVIIVSRTNKYEVLGVKRMLEEIYAKTRQWEDNLFIIWNQVPRVDAQSIQSLLEDFSQLLIHPETVPIKTLGSIPASDRYSFETTRGNLFLMNSKCETTKNTLNKLVQEFMTRL